MKRVVVVLSIILLLASGGVLFVAHQVDQFMGSPLPVPEGGVGFQIPAGSSFAAVSRKLISNELIADDRWLRLYVRWHDKGGAIQAGDYLIEQGTTPNSLLEQFTSGSVRLYAFTLVEGWNFREVLLALHGNDAVKASA